MRALRQEGGVRSRRAFVDDGAVMKIKFAAASVAPVDSCEHSVANAYRRLVPGGDDASQQTTRIGLAY
jgi:hypothetical protein